MHNLVYINEKVSEHLNTLRKEYANKKTGTPASYSKVITVLLKESGHWKKSKKQVEGDN